jgi:formate/nitrite transporter FocA (FNT family)
MTTALLHRRVSVIDVGISWFVSFFGNLAGTLFFMAIITGYGGVFEETEGYRTAAINLAVQKAQQPQWHQVRCLIPNVFPCLTGF